MFLSELQCYGYCTVTSCFHVTAEKQREEQQQRRLQEKQRWKQLEAGDSWADRFTSHQNKPLLDQPTQQVSPRATVDDTVTGVLEPPSQTEVNTSRSFSAPLDTSSEPLGR